MSEDDILIDEHGNIRFVYSDLLDSVFEEDNRETHRVSHVEPVNSPCGHGWQADMEPVGGPILWDRRKVGDNHFENFPFKTRQEALAAERKWLRENHNL